MCPFCLPDYLSTFIFMGMKIALIGYGKMGRTIEALGRKQGISFPLIIDRQNTAELNEKHCSEVDAAIEFSTPEAAADNLLKCIELGIPIVCGTTGWKHRLEEIELACRRQKGALFHANNFSIGVNILFAVNRELARIMDRFPQYRASIQEVHHVEKLDAPSGTAISLADEMVSQLERLRGWTLDKDKDEAKLAIEAHRQSDVKGIHTVLYESEMDSISLRHEAKTRDAFALGALMAADFIRTRQGIFGMQDLFNF